ncbi:MAG TPA: DUF262 domain-containing protein [Devosia sp.]|nr:DUF262 domain-containing protein [Devosia sp.]
MINTTATNKKVREIIKMVKDGSLIPRPEFQRRLVWTSKDKDFFIDTVLRAYPFPEIYIANGEVNTDTGEGTQLLVDGLQRVSTLVEYFSGDPTFTPSLSKPYKALGDDEKSRFLEYSVVVRDLGDVTKEQVVAVFKRLNSTQYTLKDMEVNNAVYNGALKKFCEAVSEDEFFEANRIFTASDRRRMGDVAFCLTLVGTIMVGYFNRDSEHENLLSRYNESFPEVDDVRGRLDGVFDFVAECGFPSSSRIWKKADLLTVLVELDSVLNQEKRPLDPSDVLSDLERFFAQVSDQKNEIGTLYYKSALQASNDRANRLRRGLIVGGLLRKQPEKAILEQLEALSLR